MTGPETPQAGSSTKPGAIAGDASKKAEVREAPAPTRPADNATASQQATTKAEPTRPAIKPVEQPVDKKSGFLSFFAAIDGLFKPIVWLAKKSAFAQTIGLAAAGYTLWSVYLTTEQIRDDIVIRQEEREERRAEGRERAWARLLLPVGGNTGKGGALNHLLSEGVSIVGVDLSCKANGQWDSQTDTCSNPPIFAGILLNTSLFKLTIVQMLPEMLLFSSKPWTASMAFTDFAVVSFAGSTLHEARARETILDSTRFEGARIERSDFSGSVWSGSAKDLTIMNSDFSYALVGFDLRAVQVVGTNLSGVKYRMSGNFVEKDIPMLSEYEMNWAWADLPPIGRRDWGVNMNRAWISKAVKLCDPHTRPTETQLQLQSLGADIREEVRGIVPQGKPALQIEDTCIPLSYEEAAKRFPKSYPIEENHF